MKNKLSEISRPTAALCRIRPATGWLLAAVLIVLGGCEKDRFTDFEKEPADAFGLTRIKSLNHPETCEPCEATGKTYKTLDDFPALRARILTQLQAAEPESRYYAGILDGSVISSVNGDIPTYTIFWQTVGNTIYKLLVRTNSAGNVAEMGVLRIAPEQSFLSGYFQNTTLLKDFVGEIGVVSVGDFLDAKRSGSFKSLGRNKSSIDDCQTLIFVNGGPIGGNGGGGQTGNPPGSDPIVRGPGPIWDTNNGSGTNGGSTSGGGCWDVSVVCGCEPRHLGGYGQSSICDCNYKPNRIVITPCATNNNLRGRAIPPGLEPQSDRAKSPLHRNKNLWWDCVDLLNGAGLLTDHDLYTLRLSRCETYMTGFEEDINDGPMGTHPDASFCSVWNPYYDRCLSHLPANETRSRWGALMWRNRAAFDYLITNDINCNGPSIATLATENPDLILTEREVCVMLQQPQLIAPISNFLTGKNGSERDQVAEIVHILLEAPSSQHCTTGVTAALIQQIDNFWEQQHDDSGDNEQLKDEIIYYLYARVLFDIGDFSEFEAAFLSQEEDLGGTPLTPGEIWAFGSEIRSRLILMYPEKESTINNFFVCRILAMAFEDVVLASLGNFDLNNQSLPGMTAKPDGYHAISFRGAQSEWVGNGLHVITEVKTKFTSPPVFNWSGNPSQFQQYRGFLENNQYQGTMPNTLYLVLPAGVEVAQSVIDACTQQNILLVTSGVQISFLNPDKVRVSDPVARNAYSLTYHPGLWFSGLAKRYPTNGMKGPFGHFEYDYVDFRQALEERANRFETSYLIGNEDPSCPDE